VSAKVFWWAVGGLLTVLAVVVLGGFVWALA
jgi:hypothetical protein